MELPHHFHLTAEPHPLVILARVGLLAVLLGWFWLAPWRPGWSPRRRRTIHAVVSVGLLAWLGTEVWAVRREELLVAQFEQWQDDPATQPEVLPAGVEVRDDLRNLGPALARWYDYHQVVTQEPGEPEIRGARFAWSQPAQVRIAPGDPVVECRITVDRSGTYVHYGLDCPDEADRSPGS